MGLQSHDVPCPGCWARRGLQPWGLQCETLPWGFPQMKKSARMVAGKRSGCAPHSPGGWERTGDKALGFREQHFIPRSPHFRPLGLSPPPLPGTPGGGDRLLQRRESDTFIGRQCGRYGGGVRAGGGCLRGRAFPGPLQGAGTAVARHQQALLSLGRGPRGREARGLGFPRRGGRKPPVHRSMLSSVGLEKQVCSSFSQNSSSSWIRGKSGRPECRGRALPLNPPPKTAPLRCSAPSLPGSPTSAQIHGSLFLFSPTSGLLNWTPGSPASGHPQLVCPHMSSTQPLTP